MSIFTLIEDLFKKSISTGSLKSSVLPKKKDVITIHLWLPGVKKGLDQVRLTLKRVQIWIPKEIGDKEPYYSTKILIFSFIWADLAALHKVSTL